MNNDNAATANDTGLSAVHVETPTGGYSFYRETDADLTTTAGRIEWFCAHFEVEKPNLEYDEDDPTAIVLTDDLLEWTQIEGVNLDWLCAGRVAGALAVHREKYRITPQIERFQKLIGKFDDKEKAILAAGLKFATETDADMDSVMQSVSAEIRAYRETAQQ